MRAPRFALALGLALALASGASAQGSAQDAAAPEASDLAGAESAVLAYVGAVTAQDWAAVAERTDPRDLARLGDFATLIAETEPLAAAMLGMERGAPPSEVLAAIMRLAFESEPLVAEAAASARAVVVGSVAEGDSLAHVVTRTAITMAGREVVTVEVVTARQDGARWVIGLDDELDAMIVGMEIALEEPELFGGEGEIELDFDAPPAPPPAPEPVRDPKKE